MKIKGILEDSMLEWSGKISLIIFTGGCNLRCPYCHNPQFIENSNEKNIPKEEILELLEEQKSRSWLDGIVLSGGEPTIHDDLPLFMQDIRDLKLDYKIKLQTNGTNPKMLEYIIGSNLADFISMDVKWPIEDYGKFSKEVEKSINLLKKGKIDYGFNTTMVPGLITKENFSEILKKIEGAKKYTLQQFKSGNIVLLDKNYINKKPYSRAELNDFLETAKSYVKECKLREEL